MNESISTYQQEYHKLLDRLSATQRKETLLLIGTALLQSLIISMTVFLVLAVIETFAHGSISFRTGLFSVWVISSLATLGYLVGREVWNRYYSSNKPTTNSIALRVGNSFSDLRDMLLNAMQLLPLVEQKNNSATSPELVYATFADVSRNAKDKNFDVIINSERTKKSFFFFLAIVGVMALVFGVSPVGSAANRILNFRTSFLPPAPFSLEIEPSVHQVLRGEKAVITVRAKGIPPSTVTFQLREEQQEQYDAYQLREIPSKDSVGIYRFEISAVKRSIEFYAESPWQSEFVRTNVGRIVVNDRPMIRAMQGKVIQPGYTGLGVREFNEQNADISCLVGSRIELNITANKDIQRATVVFVQGNSRVDSLGSTKNSDTLRFPMTVNGKSAGTSFSARSSGLYYVEITDNEGEKNLDPIRYTINTSGDGYPTISMLEPITDVQLGKDGLLNVKLTVTDDYGFSKLLLHYKLTESRYSMPDKVYKSVMIPVANLGTGGEVPYIWDVNKAGISPEDKYEFYCEVFDNDMIGGPKSAKTTPISVRLPSLDEVFKQADKTQKDAVKDLEQVMKKAESIAKDMEQIQRDMMKQKQPDWRDKKKMEDLLKQQEQMQEKVQEVQQKLEEMTQQLQENKALSPETLQKYMEMQKLLQKIDSKELREQMQKMQEAMQQMSPEQMQQAMKNFKFNEEDFKKQIERTMQLLKRIQTEQKVDELTKRADELQRQQEELKKQSENTNPNDKQAREELAKKQEAMKEDFQKLANEMKDLQQMMKEAGLDKQQNVMDEMKKAMDQLNQEMTQKQMEQSEQSLEKGDMQDAQQNMRNAAQNMKNFSQSMKNMKREMKKNLQKETARAMQQSMNDMMALSKAQEQMMKESQNMDPNSAKFSQNAQQQQRLQEQMANLANRMNQLSQKSTAVTPEMGKSMGDAMRNMQDAQQSLENRNSQMAGQQQQAAMGAMNQSMGQMQAMLQKMNGNNPGDGQGEGEGESDSQRPGQGKPGKGSFMQRLQQAANMQQGINQMMDKMGQQQGKGQGQGQGQGNDMQGEIGRMASQQGKVQKSIEELAREQKESGGDKKALGNLEKLAEEMKEIMSDMQTGNVTEETRRRQDKILSRLLDATRSMNERDYEKTRESRAGIDVQRKSPNALNLDDVESKRALQDMLRQMQQGYTKDYEQLIRRYFEKLQGNR
jgi:hypothetical protein